MSNVLAQTLSDTRQELQTIGIDDDLFRDVLAVRLLIERIGEEGNNAWWESQVLTSLGRDSLVEVTPKTRTEARFELAQRIGRKVEREAVPEDTLSLFYLGPTGEAQLEAVLENVNQEAEFDALEQLTVSFAEPGWSVELLDDATDADFLGDGPIELGQLTPGDIRDHNVLKEVAMDCLRAYGASTHGNLRVPYYTINDA